MIVDCVCELWSYKQYGISGRVEYRLCVITMYDVYETIVDL